MSFETTKINTENKAKFYKLLAKQVEGLLHSEENLIANAANLSSLLFHSIEQVNWVGFYLFNNNELVLGPFQGQVACTRIPVGKGVCGTAFEQNKTLRIEDVHAFKGHIACDSASNSELVIPIKVKNKTIGVLDIDSPLFNRFDKDDQIGCETIVQIFEKSIK
jgi:GAF domain-containing protein